MSLFDEYSTPTDDDASSLMCSVLNIVIDHSMENPTPMEPMEYQKWQDDRKTKKTPGVKVPVIRIFGPLLRDPYTGPLQSACLHIHGAFPYLLARPVVAGPDGSTRRHYSVADGQVDWDDPVSVNKIVDSLQSTLEDAIHALDLEREQRQNPDAVSQHPQPSAQRHAIIRRITVVQGRGFFTYCQGPPAPFLRVEYYDPKLRWKVKRMLEKGLEVPLSFQPDPIQYDRFEEEEPETLKFNCYEAHIPYTMQFFKDWNLAGMSYLYVRQGRIRPPLPQTCQARYRSKPFEVTRESNSVFLRSNTAAKYVWPESEQSDFAQEQCYEYFFDPKFPPPTRSTHTDVEIDCTVHDLQNIEKVIKTLPSDQNERDRIQWRAVPSLQEIWRQERRRMAKLLTPEKDFLSPRPTLAEKSPKQSQLPFTLNVKQGAERSGARLAAKGVKSLVKLTFGLEEDFRRALNHILERHQEAIQKANHELLFPAPKSFPMVSTPQTKRAEKLNSTPDIAEAIEALDSLANFEVVSTPSGGDRPGATELNADNSQWTLSAETPEAALKPCDPSQGLDSGHKHPSQQSQGNARLSYPSSQEIHQETDHANHVDPFLLSQRIDRGDSVFLDETCGRENLEEYIDPDTLLPYENLEFGHDRCRVKFTIDTDPDNSLRICGNLRSSCRRDGHEDQGECERAPPGYYKSVTTGTCVDGVLDTSNEEHDADEEDQGKFEAALTMLGSQISEEKANSTNMLHARGSYRTTMKTQLSQFMSESANAFEESKASEFDMRAESRDAESDISDVEESISTPVFSECTASPPIRKFMPPKSFPAWVGPSSQPPNRRDVETLTAGHLHASIEGRKDTPGWLKHASRYQSKFSGRSTSIVSGSLLQPVTPPPSRKHVTAWCQKQGYFPRNEQNTSNRGHSGDMKASVDPWLQIDSNSRKVVAFAPIDLSDHGQNLVSKATKDKIEEVEWETAQHWQFSMSQPSQPERTEPEENVASPIMQHYSESPARQKQPGESQVNSNHAATQTPEDDALDGIGAQGGRIHVQGGGALKARIQETQHTPMSTTRQKEDTSARFADMSLPSPLSFMAIEIHVQCRTGASRLDSKKLSMAPDSNKDKVFAVVYVYGIDPGGGESLKFLQRCCLFVSFDHEGADREALAKQVSGSMPRQSMGAAAPLHLECLPNEKRLLLRLASLVKMKDPDMLVSWDTQASGLGYIIERSHIISAASKQSDGCGSGSSTASMDMIKLLGRIRSTNTQSSFMNIATTGDEDGVLLGTVNDSEERKWKGSGLGSDWDDKVGAGAAAASIMGRLVFSGWKIVAEEVKHPNYSYLPAITAAVLNKRIPHHDDLLLTQWYSSGSERWRVLSHRLNQAVSTMLLFDALDIIGRAGEAARLSGVEFSQSFPGIRGSQYKVEGVLLRALQSLRSDERGSKQGLKNTHAANVKASAAVGQAEGRKSQSQTPWKIRRGAATLASLICEDRHYFFYSPSLEDTNRQEALEVQALTLEPESGHYKDPVVVCDFTALYPSLVIAYNLCYSTCAGKLEYHSTRREMRLEGRTTGRLGPFKYSEKKTATVIKDHFKSLPPPPNSKMGEGTFNMGDDRAYIAPTGTIYVSEDVLKGVLPQVLDEILTTRAMLKKAAKEYRKNVKGLSPAILRQLEARQLALKYVANVTYGYTSATFSGRCAMPLLADTIVECGRKTLQKAIDMANCWGKKGKWKGAKVIYGDTDSLFIRLPGRSYKEAFDFGEQLCREVTADNPPPVQLKLEKVYLGSIMQTMKRYCGMKFDSKDQRKPSFEAKGLETVRKDQCALTQKVLRNALITLFQSGISEVREYLYRQWSLIKAGKVPVSDFILTGRVRSKYRGGKEGPVQAVLAKRIGEADPGRIIRHKERLPYVIVATPGATFRLKDCVLTPLELLERWDAYTIHSAYYIERHVNAALKRCLSLSPHFIDVDSWYKACPTPRRKIHFWPVRSRSRAMITTFFGSDVCALCGSKCQASGRSLVVVCPDCRSDRMQASQLALAHLNTVQSAAQEVASECSKCNGCFEDTESFASVVEPQDASTQKQKAQNILAGGPGGECLRLPLANCVCIDCPNTFKRHSLRDQLIEATATCEILDLL